MTYEPLSFQEKLLIRNLLERRVHDVKRDPGCTEEELALAYSALDAVNKCIDIVVVTQ